MLTKIKYQGKSWLLGGISGEIDGRFPRFRSEYSDEEMAEDGKGKVDLEKMLACLEREGWYWNCIHCGPARACTGYKCNIEC